MVILEYSVDKPLNREPPLQSLVSSFITTKGYDRNHGPIPHIDPDKHQVKVSGLIKKPLSLSIAQLHSFPQHSVTCALQCAGNRRHTMRTQLKEVDGIDWGEGAVMNCTWRGPLLLSILNAAGLSTPSQPEAHVAFSCFQTEVQDASWYGGSISLSRAMDPLAEVVLALEMNGKPLPINHGFPVRVVVPGVAGARSVKWLDGITVQARESENFYQQLDYKILPPEATDRKSAEEYWGKTPAIMDMPVNSVIAVPGSGGRVGRDGEGFVEVRGYALPGGKDGPVVKVEVSGDEGLTWRECELSKEEGGGKWCWVLWRARVRVEVGKGRRVLSRATDLGGGQQARKPEWNLRGVAYNGYGEVHDLEVV
ncbi:MAG: hypothetical protein M1814_005094 [Vezdaea aestivalis]|nr:MAG: hypothetical protein M1814_005094 [Vezdaea aestivalis]